MEERNMKKNTKRDGTVEPVWSLRSALSDIFNDIMNKEKIYSPSKAENKAKVLEITPDAYENKLNNFLRREPRRLRKYLKTLLDEDLYSYLKGEKKRIYLNEDGVNFLRIYYGVDDYFIEIREYLLSRQIPDQYIHQIYDGLKGLTVGSTDDGRNRILVAFQRKYNKELVEIFKDIDNLKELISKYYKKQGGKFATENDGVIEDPYEELIAYDNASFMCKAIIEKWRAELENILQS